MIRVLPDPGPLSPSELLALTPKEAALLEAMRRLLGEVRYAQPQTIQGDPEGFYIQRDGYEGHVLTEAGSKAFLDAKGLYLELRRNAIREDADGLEERG